MTLSPLVMAPPKHPVKFGFKKDPAKMGFPQGADSADRFVSQHSDQKETYLTQKAESLSRGLEGKTYDGIPAKTLFLTLAEASLKNRDQFTQKSGIKLVLAILGFFVRLRTSADVPLKDWAKAVENTIGHPVSTDTLKKAARDLRSNQLICVDNILGRVAINHDTEPVARFMLGQEGPPKQAIVVDPDSPAYEEVQAILAQQEQPTQPAESPEAS